VVKLAANIKTNYKENTLFLKYCYWLYYL